MKKLVLAATVTLGVFALSACSSSGDDSEVVVETKDGNITKEEFYQELKSKSGESVLQQLVMTQVLENNYEVKDSEVDDQVKKLKDQYGDQFEMAIQQSGFQTEDDFRVALRTSLLQEKAVTEDIEVTEEELQQRYDRLQTEIEASHILVGDEETAKEIKQKLDDGADFATLAEENSTDTQSAQNGGQLGYFTAGDMVKEFEDAAYSMEVGEISDPVKSANGWHIIKVTDKRDTKQELGSFEDMKGELERQIKSSKVDQAKAQEKLDQIMKDANIDVKIDEFKDLFSQKEAAKK
ncbi:peptidylprolyl isomerase [Aquibacillus sp. 3ASR75-11]|uniref:Foldase protein PrsA n=1 Tax=Terrihalobacillus insolitus TaxID=2950438 RepID=A0A9X4AQB4_9BACI|nr:peptidylprolyl isomerase [Terrihalobacillus insolitus]MDC3415261.1 peptidylprolyl isomerase [Terrihalobacillus insolitus]MDC3426355.1 peptidylprolyl isomerase [Terrihalobacillus insolitus]